MGSNSATNLFYERGWKQEILITTGPNESTQVTYKDNIARFGNYIGDDAGGVAGRERANGQRGARGRKGTGAAAGAQRGRADQPDADAARSGRPRPRGIAGERRASQYDLHTTVGTGWRWADRTRHFHRRLPGGGDSAGGEGHVARRRRKGQRVS